MWKVCTWQLLFATLYDIDIFEKSNKEIKFPTILSIINNWLNILLSKVSITWYDTIFFENADAELTILFAMHIDKSAAF